MATEITNRVEIVADNKNKLNIISIMPFMCDRAIYIDDTVDANELKNITDKKIEFEALQANEQRIVFFYKNQMITDIIILEEDIEIDVKPIEFDEQSGWLNIENNISNGIRLY